VWEGAALAAGRQTAADDSDGQQGAGVVAGSGAGAAVGGRGHVAGARELATQPPGAITAASTRTSSGVSGAIDGTSCLLERTPLSDFSFFVYNAPCVR
jgi:hypothetical protein